MIIMTQRNRNRNDRQSNDVINGLNEMGQFRIIKQPIIVFFRRGQGNKIVN